MVYLNYNNLDAETQERLLAMSLKEIEKTHREQLRHYAEQHYLDYNKLLQEEAIRNLYSYNYVFNV